MPGFEHLAEEFLQDLTELKTMILIGRNCIPAQKQQQFTSPRNGNQIASKTPLGWCIIGESPPDLTSQIYTDNGLNGSQPQQRESGNGYRPPSQTRTQPAPRAPAFCAWCKDNNRVATHTTRHCGRFKQASTADRWTAIDRQGTCAVCLIGKHSPGRCPELRGDNSKCQHCKSFHGCGIECRPIPAERTQTSTARSGTLNNRSKAI